MEKYNYNDFVDIIKKYEKEYPDITSDAKEMYSIYNENIKYKDMSNIEEKDHESFVTQIMHQYSLSGSATDVNAWLERDRYGINSLNTYYNFVGADEVAKIQRAIIDNNISRDILRGIKVQTNEPNDIQLESGERVIAEFSTDNGSPELIFMEIYDKNGKLVYYYGKDEPMYDYPKEVYDDPFSVTYYKPTKKDKENFKGIEAKIKYMGQTIIQRRDSKGRKQFVYENTKKFIKKELRESIE